MPASRHSGESGECGHAHHLQTSQVLFPPEVLLILRAHRGQHVVEVHDYVNERVQESEEGAMAARRELQAHPDGERHYPVMDHVKRRHLLILLPQDEKELEGKHGRESPWHSCAPLFMKPFDRSFDSP